MLLLGNFFKFKLFYKMKQDHITRGEVQISFHFLRKSACNLSEDLRYFASLTDRFNDEQVVNILGQLSDIEDNIKEVRKVIEK